MAVRRIISTVTTTANHHLRRHLTTTSNSRIYMYHRNPQNGSNNAAWFMYNKSDAFCFHLDMPGIDNSDLKYSVSGSDISVSAQEPKVHRFGLGRCEARYYEADLKVDPFVYKLDEVKAEVKNGGLCVIVPKIRVGLTNGWVEVKMGCIKYEYDGFSSVLVRYLPTNSVVTKAEVMVV